MVCFILLAIIVAIIVISEKTEEERASPRKGVFNIVGLGSAGGLEEGKLTGYLITTKATEDEEDSWIVIDPGTLIAGIEAAEEEGTTTNLSTCS